MHVNCHLTIVLQLSESTLPSLTNHSFHTLQVITPTPASGGEPPPTPNAGPNLHVTRLIYDCIGYVLELTLPPSHQSKGGNHTMSGNNCKGPSALLASSELGWHFIPLALNLRDNLKAEGLLVVFTAFLKSAWHGNLLLFSGGEGIPSPCVDIRASWGKSEKAQVSSLVSEVKTETRMTPHFPLGLGEEWTSSLNCALTRVQDALVDSCP